MSTLAKRQEEYNRCMAQEIDLGGTIYISSKHAAEKTGYTQDYIGQLARGGSIEAKRVSGMWYILEESLRAYKEKADQFIPTPPEGFTKSPGAEVAVSFDGKDYISASRAAKLTGYNQDYVGQLARGEVILSRQVGNRWYVDRESILKHKAEKDALLAAVQVESVGLAKPEDLAPIEAEAAPRDESAPVEEEVTHFSYVKEEEAPLIPAFETEEPEPMPEFPRRRVSNPTFEAFSPLPEPTAPTFAETGAPEPLLEPIAEEVAEAQEPVLEEVNIPIRVMPPAKVLEEVYIEEDLPQKMSFKSPRISIFAISSLTVVAALGTLVYMGSSLGFFNLDRAIPEGEIAQNAAVANSVVENGSSKAENFLRNLFSKEIVYKRQ